MGRQFFNLVFQRIVRAGKYSDLGLVVAPQNFQNIFLFDSPAAAAAHDQNQRFGFQYSKFFCRGRFIVILRENFVDRQSGDDDPARGESVTRDLQFLLRRHDQIPIHAGKNPEWLKMKIAEGYHQRAFEVADFFKIRNQRRSGRMRGEDQIRLGFFQKGLELFYLCRGERYAQRQDQFLKKFIGVEKTPEPRGVLENIQINRGAGFGKRPLIKFVYVEKFYLQPIVLRKRLGNVFGNYFMPQSDGGMHHQNFFLLHLLCPRLSIRDLQAEVSPPAQFHVIFSASRESEVRRGRDRQSPISVSRASRTSKEFRWESRYNGYVWRF